MRVKKYANAEHGYLKHNGFTMWFTLIDQSGGKEAHSVSIPNLTYTKFTSEKLTKESAKTIGEMILKLAELLS